MLLGLIVLFFSLLPVRSFVASVALELMHSNHFRRDAIFFCSATEFRTYEVWLKKMYL